MNPSACPPIAGAPSGWPAPGRARPIAAALLLCVAAASALAQTSPGSPPGRLLASNCFQCHGTNGKGPGFERLAGKPAQEIFETMKRWKSVV